MSAICGMFYRDGRPFESESLQPMMDALAHRGKDGSGVWCNSRLGFGHQMLRITPESRHEQLPYKSDSRLVITAEARIDNRDELLGKLNTPRDQGAELPDSHLILHAYEKWGESCPEHLEGSYAFAIWDERMQQLFCAVDPLGSRILYTYCTPRLFLFSTEIKGILALPGLGIRLDEAGFAQLAFLAKTHRDPTITSFEGISLMRAATSRTTSARAQRTRTYWEPDFKHEIRFSTEDQYLEQFRELFNHSVRSCMRSSYAVGAFLSGGLDSSAIVCTAARLHRQQGKTLAAISSVLPEGCPGPEKDERQYIDIVKQQENIPVLYVHPPITGLCGHLEKAIELSEDPRFNHSYFLYAAFQETARKADIRVMLCGSRGEIGPSSYGNGYLPELALGGHWGKLAANLRELAMVTDTSFFKVAFSEVVMPLLPAGISRSYGRLRGRRPVTFAERLIAQPGFFHQAMASAGITPPLFMADKLTLHPHQKQMAFTLFNNTCIPSPMNAMLQDQEMAFPFADKRLLEFCLALPGEMKIRHGWKRYLLRAGMEGILPPEIQWRKSKGQFSPDFFRRVAASRQEVVNILEEMETDHGLYNHLETYVDLGKMKSFAHRAPSCESWADWKGFEPSWQLLLRGMNILFFLKWSREKLTANGRVTR